jgi:bifunctional DNase/RNase
MKAMLEALDSYVERVDITRVEEGTFYAAITLRAEERTRIVDARPSDSIALAIRMGAPIFVAEEVLDAAAVPDDSEPAADEEAQLAAFRDFLDSVNPEDFQG